MNRNFLVRLHRSGPWIITAVIVVFVLLSPVLFRASGGNGWVWRWGIVGGLVVLLTLIYALLSYGVLKTETRIGLAIAQAQESGRAHAASGDEDAYGMAVPGSVDAGREENAVRVTLLALGRKVQASAHRIQEEAGRMVQRHPSDPDVLETSMRVDHAAAQQARLAQSIATLCGQTPGQQWQDALPLGDVVRAASGRITAFQRVVIEGDPAVAVDGSVAEPLIHMVAELLANATQSSPPGTQVTATLRSVHRGAAIEIDDGGVGLDEADMNRLREIISGRQVLTIVNLGEVPQTGLAVVGTYARRHGFRVDLTDSVHGGVRVVVLVPTERLVALADPALDAAGQLFDEQQLAGAPMGGQLGGSQYAGDQFGGGQLTGGQMGAGSMMSGPVTGQLGSARGYETGAQQFQPPAWQQQPQQSGQFPPAQQTGQFPPAQQSGQFPPAQQSGQFPQRGSSHYPQQSGQFPPQLSAPQPPSLGSGSSASQIPGAAPDIPDYPDMSNLPPSPSVNEPPTRTSRPRQMRPMRNDPPQLDAPAPRMPSSSSGSFPPPTTVAPVESSTEGQAFTSDGLPQRRSRRSEAPPPDENMFVNRRAASTAPEPTAEQAGAWMNSFLGSVSDPSPTSDIAKPDDWSNNR